MMVTGNAWETFILRKAIVSNRMTRYVRRNAKYMGESAQ